MYLTDLEDSVWLTFTFDNKPLQILGRCGVHADTVGTGSSMSVSWKPKAMALG
jgi:hypothetical protein